MRTENKKIPPRERILAAARELFYRQGIRAVGVEAIAEAAGTNKMTLYRHFESKDALVAECLRQLAAEAEAEWDAIAARHPGKPCAQIRDWLQTIGEHVADPGGRGCALANAAIELRDPNHPARRVIEAHKSGLRQRLVALCAASGAREPERLADEIFLLIEGARVSLQSAGPEGPGSRLASLVDDVVRQHLGEEHAAVR